MGRASIPWTRLLVLLFSLSSVAAPAQEGSATGGTEATEATGVEQHAVQPRDLDDALVGTWVLDFQLTEQLSQQRLGIGDASIQLRFTPEPELSPEDLELPNELEAVEPLPSAAEVRSAGRLSFGSLGEGVYFVTGPDGALDLHYVRETESSELGAPWTFRLTLKPKEPPRQDLLVLGGSDRFADAPLVYARRSRERP
jgi:hypothetical protein